MRLFTLSRNRSCLPVGEIIEMTVRANHETQARLLAAEMCGPEGATVWNWPQKSWCSVGEPTVGKARVLDRKYE